MGRRTVYEALQERLGLLFKTFDYCYVSFSGGKDSGVLLHACIDYIRKNRLGCKLGVFHLDYEVQYGETVGYVDRTLTQNRDILEVFRVCVPVKVSSCTSMHQQFWRPWDPAMRESWVREKPKDCWEVSAFPFFNSKMWDYEFHYRFAAWLREYKGVKRVACLIGIRTQESLNRWRTIYRPRNYFADGKPRWINKVEPGVFNVYPIYDWLTTDVWTANGRFKWDYNRLYDLYYYAGVPIEQQRVASPFISQAISSLHLYRAIDPDMWGKMLCRVNGVNFAGLYGRSSAMGWRKVSLPRGMLWKDYLSFLLDTLPEEARRQYLKKLAVSKKFWKHKGGCLSSATIKRLKAMGVSVSVGKRSNYRTNKLPVRMDYLDDIDLPEFRELPTYKRVCICILKNDYFCKYMGFAPTKNSRERRHQILRDYAAFLADERDER